MRMLYAAAMFAWDDLRSFLAVHREGSLAAAGRKLRADPTTVGRRVAALEEALGVPLFVRGPDGWSLSPAGERVLTAAERAEEAALDVQRRAAGAESEPAGRVRLTTLEIVASRVVAPLLPELHRRYPNLQLDLICTPRKLDLLRGAADLAIRIGRPDEPSLVGRRLQTLRARPYAAASWLEERGLQAESLDRLEGLELLLFPGPNEWLEGLGEGRVVLRCTAVAALLRAATEGLGVAMLPEVLAASRPELRALPALGVVQEQPLWLVMHPDMARVSRVRAVADVLVEHLAE